MKKYVGIYSIRLTKHGMGSAMQFHELKNLIISGKLKDLSCEHRILRAYALKFSN